MRNSCFLKLLPALLIVLELSGCATMFGRQQDEQLVFFNSKIADVEVNCEGKSVKTPGSIALRQSRDHACTAEKAGYQKEVIEVKSGTSWMGFAQSVALNTAAWGWWTLGIGTGIGMLVDFPSGAMRNLKQEHVDLDLRPVDDRNVQSVTS